MFCPERTLNASPLPGPRQMISFSPGRRMTTGVTGTGDEGSAEADDLRTPATVETTDEHRLEA